MDGVTQSADGLSVRFETRGTGTPAIVFVHGWSGDRSHWAHQLEHFAAHHRVVPIDQATEALDSYQVKGGALPNSWRELGPRYNQ